MNDTPPNHDPALKPPLPPTQSATEAAPGIAKTSTTAPGTAPHSTAAPTWSSDQLLGQANEAHIVHGGEVYRLLRTRNQKLILVK